MQKEFEFAVGDKATHSDTGISGTVRGVHWDRTNQVFVQIEYVDASSQVNDRWFPEAELAAAN